MKWALNLFVENLFHQHTEMLTKWRTKYTCAFDASRGTKNRCVLTTYVLYLYWSLSKSYVLYTMLMFFTDYTIYMWHSVPMPTKYESLLLTNMCLTNLHLALRILVTKADVVFHFKSNQQAWITSCLGLPLSRWQYQWLYVECKNFENPGDRSPYVLF